MDTTYKGRTESSKDDWMTPQPFIDSLCKALHIKTFDLDACADERSNKGRYYTHDLLQFLDNPGLVEEFLRGYVWCNPPFNLKNTLVPALISKVRELPETKLIMLLPVAVETRLWRDYVWHEDLVFPGKRVKFIDPATGKEAPGGATFPIALLCMNLTLEELRGVHEAVDANRTVLSGLRWRRILEVDNA